MKSLAFIRICYLLIFTGGGLGISQTAHSQSRLPDLVILDAAVTAANRFPALGTTRTLSYTATNQGAATAYNTVFGIYLSIDSTLSDDDRFLQEGAVSKTSSPGGTLKASGVVVIPSDVSAVRYYLIVRADYKNRVAELDETNNTAAVAIALETNGEDKNPPPASGTSLVDLSVTATLEKNDLPAKPGDRVTAFYTVRNTGESEIDDPIIGFYLSEDADFDDRDILLETEELSDLDGNESDDESEQFSLPDAESDGNYFILIVADPFNAVEESNEGNNISAEPITITSDDTTPQTTFTAYNYPNPFQKQTTIYYTLPVSTNVRLTVYTTYGKKVARLVNEWQSAGEHSVAFEAGAKASGPLVYRLTIGSGQQLVGRMLRQP